MVCYAKLCVMICNVWYVMFCYPVVVCLLGLGLSFFTILPPLFCWTVLALICAVAPPSIVAPYVACSAFSLPSVFSKSETPAPTNIPAVNLLLTFTSFCILRFLLVDRQVAFSLIAFAQLVRRDSALPLPVLFPAGLVKFRRFPGHSTLRVVVDLYMGFSRRVGTSAIIRISIQHHSGSFVTSGQHLPLTQRMGY